MLFFKIRDFDDLGAIVIMKESDAYDCILTFRINSILYMFGIVCKMQNY